jgi:hypothetical protein
MLREVAFLVGCLGTRFAIAALSATDLSDGQRKVFAAVALAIGTSFAAIYLMGWRKTGAEAGGVIWWNNLRPIHSALWLLAGYSLLREPAIAHRFLYADAALGLVVWVAHKTGNL